MKPQKKPVRIIEQNRGFALVVTLTLMILLSILALGMLSLSSVAIRSSGSVDSKQIARANARMAMLIALGNLQTYLGPDKRVSARAETLAKDSRVGGTVSPFTPKAWWVGVSHSDKTMNFSESGKAVAASTDGSKPVKWLLSGLNGGDFGNSLTDPVKMIGEGSLDLSTMTGGDDIQAGRVPMKDSDDKITGSYAWYIDDNGMKAQLRPSDPEIRNDDPTYPSGGVLAAAYDPSILENLGDLNATPEQLQKIGGNADLEFVGLSRPVIRSKFFGYTPRSQGVLSDTKNGGLKKDLTIAFEFKDGNNFKVFTKVFPKGNTSKYLLISEEKLNASTDLKSNGYIHWDIYKDYYNLKTSIKSTGVPSIQVNTFDKGPFLFDDSRVNKAPHKLNDGSTKPYGQPTVKFGSAYVNNPIHSILARMQENAWVEYTAPTGTAKAKLSTHAQLWSSHYNPYNIALDVSNGASTGPRMMNFPMIAVTVEGYLNRVDTIGDKLQVHAPEGALIPPGKSQMLGFKADKKLGEDEDDRLYSANVKNLVSENVRVEHTLANALPSTSRKVVTEFYNHIPTFMIGCDDKSGGEEVSQVFFTPFAWDRIPSGRGSIDSTKISSSTPTPGKSGTYGPRDKAGDRPGKMKSRNLTPNEFGISSMASFTFKLRTTKENNSALRPLVDANIRAQWNNPRWDGPLGLNVVATHSMDFNGESSDPVPLTENNTPPLGFTFLGSGNSSLDPNRVILFDIPRRDLVSLGQLQHAAAGRFSYEPSYIVGNSYANPRIGLTNWKASVSDQFSDLATSSPQWKISGNFDLFDASYIVNEVLFDSYVFTTIPQVDDNFGGGDVPRNSLSAIKDGTIQLPNPRFRPYEPSGSKFDAGALQNEGTASTGSFFHNAGHLLVDGSFNVNSTSVDAWEAFLSGTFELPVAKIDTTGAVTGYVPTEAVRFPRVASNLGTGMETSAIDENYWTGFRELTQTEVRDIATELVGEIKTRGPFLTMGDFVNRRLKNDDTGKSGALQAALDKTINTTTGGMASAAATSGAFSNIPSGATQGAGFPGQLLQGDVLQALGPFMTVRSDTFTIRAYGEAKAPNGNITATAWCEAIVQRFPDPITPTTAAKSPLEELALPSSEFGRKFEIISFRWLHPEEV